MREITVITENRVGALADVCEALSSVGVNIKSISAQGIGETGIIRLVTGDEKTAKRALELKGFKFIVGDLMTIKLKDRPGELTKVARKLARAGVDIESIYVLDKSNDVVELAIKPANIRKAMKALKG